MNNKKETFSMLKNENNCIQEEKTPDYRLISNPFDSPSSVHLRERLASFSIFNDQQDNQSIANDILSIERRAQVYPQQLSEHIVQIDTSLFNEEMRDRYQRASDYFCHTQLDLPTPVTTTNQIIKLKSPSSSSTTTSNSFLDQTRTIRHMGCQTRLTLPPAADLDSLIQSFTSNGDIDDPPIAISNSSLNNSQIRRKLFSDEDDLLDETPPLVQPRRSSSFDPGHRSSSPSQQQTRENFLFQHLKPVTPDCSPIPLKTTTNSTKHSRFELLAQTPQQEAVIMTSVSRPTHYLSLVSSPVTNMSIGSPFIHPPQMQMPSDYARQVLDNALADLMECSM